MQLFTVPTPSLPALGGTYSITVLPLSQHLIHVPRERFIMEFATDLHARLPPACRQAGTGRDYYGYSRIYTNINPCLSVIIRENQ
jgi:hypothetical protein